MLQVGGGALLRVPFTESAAGSINEAESSDPPWDAHGQ